MSRPRFLRAAVACSVLAATSAAVLAPSAADAALVPNARPATIGVGGEFMVALAPNGTVRTWGENYAAQLGNGTTDDANVPVQVKGLGSTGVLDHVVQVAAGGTTGVALRSDGTVATWGGGTVGQLGDNGMWNATSPVLVHSLTGTGNLTGAVQVAEGENFAVALLGDGSVVTWGGNGNGQLGRGTTSTQAGPARVLAPTGSGTLSHIVAIGVGGYAACAITSTGTVYAWGSDAQGQLGDNDTTYPNKSRPVQVTGIGGTGVLSGVVQVAGNWEGAIALRSNGSVVTWGSNGSGQLGIGSSASTISPPVAVQTLASHVAYIASGEDAYHDLAITDGGLVYTWGYNVFGQLGDGATTTTTAPNQVEGLATQNVVQAAADPYTSAVVTSSGAVYDFGRNDGGQLGNGTSAPSHGVSRPDNLTAAGVPKLYLRVAPVLGGHAQTNYTLTVTSGTWGLPATSYAYQWIRDGRAISGATHSTYRLTTADKNHRVAVQVFATRTGYPRNGTTTRSVYISK